MLETKRSGGVGFFKLKSDAPIAFLFFGAVIVNKADATAPSTSTQYALSIPQPTDFCR